MRYDVLAVGGGPGGIITAVQARRVYGEDLKIEAKGPLRPKRHLRPE